VKRQALLRDLTARQVQHRGPNTAVSISIAACMMRRVRAADEATIVTRDA